MKKLSKLKSGQYPEIHKSRKGDVRKLKSRAFHGDAWPRTLQEAYSFGPCLGNRSVFILDPRLSPLPFSPENAFIFSRALHLCVTWNVKSQQTFKWFFAYSNPQSIAVIRLAHPEQSSRFCSLRETSFPVFLKCCPSSDPVTLNAQELPNSPEKYNRT